MVDLGKLRPIGEHEVETMLVWRNEPAIRSNMYNRHKISLEEHLAWWSGVRTRSDIQYYMYEFHGTPSGIVAYTALDTVNGNSSWAFYAAPSAPRGTGSRMEYVALERFFDQPEMVKLYCEVLQFNQAVIKMHQKFGFVVEGVFRRHHKVDGKFVDVYRLGLLREDWVAKRPELLARITHMVGAN